MQRLYIKSSGMKHR